jgi:hypothetical protein
MAQADFMNDDGMLRQRVEQSLAERKKLKLEGQVGDLECIIVNVEPDNLEPGVSGILGSTGYEMNQCFEDDGFRTCVLSLEGSADILVRTRKLANPFAAINDRPKSGHLPNTRLETFVFGVSDLPKFMAAQSKRGPAFLGFMEDKPLRGESFLFAQTNPSPYTGNSIGFIEWTGRRGEYHTGMADWLDVAASKPEEFYLGNIGRLDHAATRVRAEERDDAIIEFMGLTNYDFKFAVYVEALNSITNVARLGPDDFAMVFTSGITPFAGIDDSGPTEKFIHNYGTRVHHLAFSTENIEDTYRSLVESGQKFLVELVGSRQEGLKQTFTTSFPQTMLVNEYIHRYDDFDGFFTKSNVTALTKSTERQ